MVSSVRVLMIGAGISGRGTAYRRACLGESTVLEVSRDRPSTQDPSTQDSAHTPKLASPSTPARTTWRLVHELPATRHRPTRDANARSRRAFRAAETREAPGADAAYDHRVGAPMIFERLPAESSDEGTSVPVSDFDRRHPATIVANRASDSEITRMRC